MRLSPFMHIPKMDIVLVHVSVLTVTKLLAAGNLGCIIVTSHLSNYSFPLCNIGLRWSTPRPPLLPKLIFRTQFPARSRNPGVAARSRF